MQASSQAMAAESTNTADTNKTAGPVSPVLRVENLSVDFDVRGRSVNILSSVNFELQRGQTLGIIGESGCGKSMTALALLRMIPSPPGRISGGKVLLEGEDLVKASKKRITEAVIPTNAQTPGVKIIAALQFGLVFLTEINIPLNIQTQTPEITAALTRRHAQQPFKGGLQYLPWNKLFTRPDCEPADGDAATAPLGSLPQSCT